MLIGDAVKHVPRKMVELPDKHTFKLTLWRVFDHALKVWSVVRLAGNGAINVFADHSQVVVLRIIIAIAQLSSNRLFGLVVA